MRLREQGQKPKAGLGMKDGKREEGRRKDGVHGTRNRKKDRTDAPETRRGDDRL